MFCVGLTHWGQDQMTDIFPGKYIFLKESICILILIYHVHWNFLYVHIKTKMKYNTMCEYSVGFYVQASYFYQTITL